MTRSQIPQFALLFSDANVQSVSETEIRGQTVFEFSMRVNNVRQDVEPFRLDRPRRNYDVEQGEEIELDLSSIDDETSTEFYSEAPSEIENSAGNPSNESAAGSSRSVTSPQSDHRVETDTSMNESISSENESSISEPEIVTNSSESSLGLMGPEDEMLDGAYTIVLHSILDDERALQEHELLKDEGYKATLWDVVLADNRTWWRIGVGQFETVSAALEAVQKLPAEYRERNFIIRIREGQ